MAASERVLFSSKAAIMKFALEKRASGEFCDTGRDYLEDNFRGSIDRFCDIAFARK